MFRASFTIHWHWKLKFIYNGLRETIKHDNKTSSQDKAIALILFAIIFMNG